MALLVIVGVAAAERSVELPDAEEQEADGQIAGSSVDADGHSRRHRIEPAELTGPTRGRIEFDHVACSYTADKPLITDLSLVAEPGQTIAIVGPTGAGKTSLLNPSKRCYEGHAGRTSPDRAGSPAPDRRAARSGAELAP